VELNGTAAAILIGVWSTFALDVFSTLNSSPQTTELFAGDRESTLWHWVLIGGAVATVVSRKPWPLIATLIVGLGMLGLYRHAIKRGQGVAPPEGAE
jgi:uncharacterized membrane protein (UPF0136 family)